MVHCGSLNFELKTSKCLVSRDNYWSLQKGVPFLVV